ncbi:PEP-CTERM sorting domain-containing protein [Paucibacter sp. B2R-40]|uniref:PEP-CTERM sorting domain-containing protein n=1 Tax=Paucibacter sp. B2R-40 TaxID=2893554 RepID=UPI0021E477BA|nr:PEP-CTERM sorting domain-containing protein [Paucibacter sp. B2R-40]MCV2356029.1 PEP-CTERM sorting domain-containing protein [Paucibacter sp. B2R-40]
MKMVLTLIAAACYAVGSANADASSLLLDGDFNSKANWTQASVAGGWANFENAPAVSLNGSQYLVTGAAGNGGGGSFSQTVLATAGQNYTLSVFSGADAWWLPTGSMTMYFLNNATLLGSASRNTVDPAEYGTNYDIPHPWAAYALKGTAPAGTTEIRVEFAANNATGSIWFEDASLTVSAVPEPSSAALLALGAALLLGVGLRQQKPRD